MAPLKVKQYGWEKEDFDMSTITENVASKSAASYGTISFKFLMCIVPLIGNRFINDMLTTTAASFFVLLLTYILIKINLKNIIY